MKLLLAILLMISSSAFAAEVRFEALAGTCEYGLSPKGDWWNDHYETNIDRVNVCYQIGVSQVPWRLGKYNLGWRVHYVDFGKLTTNSVMAIRDEDQFENPSGKYCNPKTLEGCLIRTVGGSHAKGVSIGGVIERKFGGFTGGLEAGAFVYYNSFRVRVTAHPEGAYDYDAIWDSARGWHSTPYAGVTGRYDWFFVNARAYQSLRAAGDCPGCTGITGDTSYSLTAGIAKEF